VMLSAIPIIHLKHEYTVIVLKCYIIMSVTEKGFN